MKFIVNYFTFLSIWWKLNKEQSWCCEMCLFCFFPQIFTCWLKSLVSVGMGVALTYRRPEILVLLHLCPQTAGCHLNHPQSCSSDAYWVLWEKKRKFREQALTTKCANLLCFPSNTDCFNAILSATRNPFYPSKPSFYHFSVHVSWSAFSVEKKELLNLFPRNSDHISTSLSQDQPQSQPQQLLV